MVVHDQHTINPSKLKRVWRDVLISYKDATRPPTKSTVFFIWWTCSNSLWRFAFSVCSLSRKARSFKPCVRRSFIRVMLLLLRYIQVLVPPIFLIHDLSLLCPTPKKSQISFLQSVLCRNVSIPLEPVLRTVVTLLFRLLLLPNRAYNEALQKHPVSPIRSL